MLRSIESDTFFAWAQKPQSLKFNSLKQKILVFNEFVFGVKKFDKRYWHLKNLCWIYKPVWWTLFLFSEEQMVYEHDNR